MVMSLDIASSVSLPPRHFGSTVALRQAVMSKGDEYSDYERSIFVEINLLREDPVAYSFIVESEATVGYPFVRDDPLPAHCSEMTLEQLRVYIEDFRRERLELRESLQKMRLEWTEAEANMRERWAAEDAERAKRSKRGTSGGRRLRAAVMKEEDYMMERQRAAQELQDDHTRRVNEAKSRLSIVERSCKWAIDGANAIIKCVQELREAQAAPVLEYNRGLSLAARDVGNECCITLATSKLPSPTIPPVASLSSLCPHTTSDEEVLRLPAPVSRRGSGGATTLASPSFKTQQKAQPPSLLEHSSNLAHDSNVTNGNINPNIKDSASNVSSLVDEDHGGDHGGDHGDDHGDDQGDEHNAYERALSSLSETCPTSLETAALPSSSSMQEGSSESELLRKATLKACSRYGYFSGAVRGVQLCGAFAPRKMLIQMLLSSRVSRFTLLAPNATGETCGFSSIFLSKQTKDLLMWSNGRLLGCGWVRAPDGVVSVTVLITTSFEELSVLHTCHDFSFPQIHRILNSHVMTSLRKGGDQQAVLDIHSSLNVRVVEPVAHPIFPEKEQRVVRLLVHADPHVVEVTATVASALDPTPSVPVLDCELLLVQRSRDNIAEVEILLDVSVARRRWLGRALLVHLFERSRSVDTVGPFKNIGFVRVTFTRRVGDRPSECKQSDAPLAQGPAVSTLLLRSPAVLARWQCEGPVQVRETPHGWPLVTIDFQNRCATIIEPLNGTWIAFGDKQHIAIQIPDYDYLQANLSNVGTLLEKEMMYFKRGDAVGSQEEVKELIMSTMARLSDAEKELHENGGPLQQELAQVQKSMAKKRGKELAKLEKQEREIRKRLDNMNDAVADLRHELTAAKEDLVRLGREYTLRSLRQRRLQQEYVRLCRCADRTRPLRVQLTLVPEDFTLCSVPESTQLRPTNAANTIYEADVQLVKGFKGRAVLFVNNQETVLWEVRPGY